MSPSAFYKMRDEVKVSMIVAIFIACIVALIPNYQKNAYANTSAREYDKYEDNTGYPAAEEFPTVNSIAEIDACEDRNFTIIINMTKLKALDLYMGIKDRKFSTNSIMRVINNNNVGGIGRFFVAELESGEQVVIFLDDTALSLPKEGVVTLPIGRLVNLAESKFLNVLQEKAGIANVDSYIDMAGDWRSGEEAESLNMTRWFGLAVIFIVLWVFLSRLLTKLGER